MRLLILLFVVSATIYSADAFFFDLRGIGRGGNILFRSIGDLIFGKLDPEDTAEQKPNNQKQLNQPMRDNSKQKTKEPIQAAETTKPNEATEPNQQDTTEQKITNTEQVTDATLEKSRFRRDITRVTQPPLPSLLKSLFDNNKQHRGRTTHDFQYTLKDWKTLEKTIQDGITFFKHITDLFETDLDGRKRRAVDEEDFKSIQSCVIDAVKEIISCVTKTSDDGLEASEDVGDAKDIGKCIVKAIMDFVVCTAK